MVATRGNEKSLPSLLLYTPTPPTTTGNREIKKKTAVEKGKPEMEKYRVENRVRKWGGVGDEGEMIFLLFINFSVLVRTNGNRIK